MTELFGTAESYMLCRRQLDAAGNSMASGPTEATLALLRSLVDNVRYLLAQAESEVAESAAREARRVAVREGV
ncbi:hypothetical protein [Paraburkholderia gardini]|uniref:hypothetical protein n=1 Tax=Paraburkholderia gardini TaxID=2823469 RepID=UPI001D368AEA|nr:hypothetical protein [Paraburkholderia gardini]CAG4889462.1 hypothetical protein R69919_00749 [Paraburkholderia gardini]